MEQVLWGKTGLTVSRLSIGTGSNGWAHRSEQTALGLDGLANLLRSGWERGINLWDAADQYGSHPHVARALRGLPRERVVVVTKTTAQDHRHAAQDVERFRRELNSETLDVVLLHFLSRGDWPKRYAGAMDALSQAQTKGQVRAVGVSCHSLSALRAALTCDWAQVVLARINYAGQNMDASPAEVVPVLNDLYRAGKAVYGMKVLACGRLIQDVRKAIRYVLELRTVYALTIGTSSLAQLEENVRLMEELSPQFPLLPLPGPDEIKP